MVPRRGDEPVADVWRELPAQVLIAGPGSDTVERRSVLGGLPCEHVEESATLASDLATSIDGLAGSYPPDPD